MSDARKQVTLDGGMTGLLEFAGVDCESIEILPDIQYITVSDYLSHLGTYSSKAAGRIQDVSVKSHQDERHLNEHTDRRTAGRFRLHRNYPGPFSPSTKMTYGVPINIHGALRAYDAFYQDVTG